MCENSELPLFKYFLDPVGVEVFIQSENVCLCCKRARGVVYSGSYLGGPDDLEFDSHLCPWCIADGSAAQKFGLEFVDEDGIGDHGRWDQADPDVIEEVSKRTPCFTPWQQECWWTHCGDAAVFIDYAGKEELIEYGQECIENIRSSIQPMDDENWESAFDAMEKDGSVIAYVFQCRHCGVLGGYWDCM